MISNFPQNYLETKFFYSICSPIVNLDNSNDRVISYDEFKCNSHISSIINNANVDIQEIWSETIGDTNQMDNNTCCNLHKFLSILSAIKDKSQLVSSGYQIDIPFVDENDLQFNNNAVQGKLTFKKYFRKVSRTQSLLNMGLIQLETIEQLWIELIGGLEKKCDFNGYVAMNNAIDEFIEPVSNNKKRSKSIKNIYIRASDAAACIGLNQYKSSEQVLEEMWLKYSPETAEELITVEDEISAILQKDKSGTLQSIVQSTIQQVATSNKKSSEVINLINEKVVSIQAATSELKLNLPEQQKVVEYLQSTTSKLHGTNSEKRTADSVQQIMIDKGIKSNLLEDDNFYSCEIYRTELYRYVLVGKIDRIEVKENGDRVVVEIKNRMRRLFRRVPPYEYVQLQVYLHLLGVQDGKPIEQFNDEVNEMDVPKDDLFLMDNVLPGLLAFVSRLDTILSDPQARQEYLSFKATCPDNEN